MKTRAVSVLALLVMVPTVSCATYSLNSAVIASGFYEAFTFENIADPTNGRVNYVDQATAQSQNLSYVTSDNTFILGADDVTVLNPSGPGRNSFRIKSLNTYQIGVFVFDIVHMPQGCGTWPAIWTTSEANWPNGGEIDILEGADDHSPNTATLHTSPGCTMPASQNQLGTPTQLDCNAELSGNPGCGVTFPTTQSYGPQFNSIGGGWYAMERTSTDIRVWFWPRGGPAPSDASTGASTVVTVMRIGAP